jgi:hypothetical protein
MVVRAMGGTAAETEVCLRHFRGRMRELIPAAWQQQRLPAGWSRV